MIHVTIEHIPIRLTYYALELIQLAGWWPWSVFEENCDSLHVVLKIFTSFVFVNKEPQFSMYFVKLTKLVSYLLNLDQTYQHVKSSLYSWNLFFFQSYVCFTYFSTNKKCFITRTHVTVQVLKFFGKRHCLKELRRHCIKRKLCSINLWFFTVNRCCFLIRAFFL